MERLPSLGITMVSISVRIWYFIQPGPTCAQVPIRIRPQVQVTIRRTQSRLLSPIKPARSCQIVNALALRKPAVKLEAICVVAGVLPAPRAGQLRRQLQFFGRNITERLEVRSHKTKLTKGQNGK